MGETLSVSALDLELKSWVVIWDVLYLNVVVSRNLYWDYRFSLEAHARHFVSVVSFVNNRFV